MTSPETMIVGQLTLVLLVAVPLAFLATLLLLAIYLRAVQRSMRHRAAPAASPPAHEASAPGSDLAAASGDGATFDLAEAPPAKDDPAANARTRRALSGPWWTAAIYAIAGMAYAKIVAAANIAAGGFIFAPIPFVFITLCLAWPIVITSGLVAATSWRAWATILAVYFALVVAAAAVLIAHSNGFTWASAAWFWQHHTAEGTLLVLPFLARSVRAVGPMVLAFMILFVGGTITAILTVGASEDRIKWFLQLGAPWGLDSVETLIGFVIAGILALGLAGWIVLRVIGFLYRAKWISDQSLVIDAIWLLFAVTSAMGFAFIAPVWTLAPFGAFAVYKIIALAGFALRRRFASAGGDDPKLLLLRVFSLGRRSEHLFATFGKLWRYAGSIRLIAGPDLATTTVEPHEFLDFLSGKLARRFISGPDALAQRLSETTTVHDFDGRSRVGDFFCHDDTWQMVLGRLAEDSNAVLMDLRGFTPAQSGCIYEIKELIDLVPLDRVVFVIDETTDEAFLRKTFGEGWSRMRANSPNRQRAANGENMAHAVRIFRLTGTAAGSVPGLVRAVASAVAGGALSTRPAHGAA